MKCESGFTLVELMLALTLSMTLMLCLVEVYTHTQQRYVLLTTISHIQLRGDYATRLIEQRLAHVSNCEVKSPSQLAFEWRRRLKSLSDVMICHNDSHIIRLYLSRTSWQYRSHKVSALFEKVNRQPRLELVPFVKSFTASVKNRLLQFHLVITSQTPVLLILHTLSKVSGPKYIERQWYGTVVLQQ